MKSGPNAVKISAGNNCAQYVCCAGVVTTRIHAIQEAKPPMARMYRAGMCEMAHELVNSATAPITARVA